MALPVIRGHVAAGIGIDAKAINAVLVHVDGQLIAVNNAGPAATAGASDEGRGAVALLAAGLLDVDVGSPLAGLEGWGWGRGRDRGRGGKGGGCGSGEEGAEAEDEGGGCVHFGG